jgi:hypothetical protein
MIQVHVTDHAIERAIERFGCKSPDSAQEFLRKAYECGRDGVLRGGPVRIYLGVCVGMALARKRVYLTTVFNQAAIETPRVKTAGLIKPKDLRGAHRTSRSIAARHSKRDRAYRREKGVGDWEGANQ